MENLDQESKSQSQPEIFIFSEPGFGGREVHRVLFSTAIFFR
jgi:hypothetical protein